MRGNGACLPVKPINPATVTLCAESNTFLLASTTLSNLDTFAAFALSCAARNRATFCSGVSNIAEGPLGPPGPAGPPEPPLGGGRPAPALEGVNRGGGVAFLELACNVVAVNRVASETLRGAAHNRNAGFIVTFCRRILSGPVVWCPRVARIWDGGNAGVSGSFRAFPLQKLELGRRPLGSSNAKPKFLTFRPRAAGMLGQATPICRNLWLTPGRPTQLSGSPLSRNFGGSSLARGPRHESTPTSTSRQLSCPIHIQTCVVYQG